MSRRTSDASKAIRKAWQQEQERVLEGKGTRDWTPEQQQDIIEKGKAYDVDGKAFHGQHMKSADKYPEFQGDPDNIQFLTPKEHLAAHKGNWHTPTNWYYNPVTYEFTDFGEGIFIPCTVIDLSSPVIMIDIDRDKTEVKQKVVKKESVSPTKDSKQTSPPNISATKPEPAEEKKGFKGLLNKAVAGGKKVAKWGVEHKEIIVGAFSFIGTVAVAIAKTSNNSSASKPTDSQNNNTYPSNDFDESSAEDTADDCFDVEEDDNSSTGSPKSPHSRRGYSGHRWKKNEDGDLELTETWISPAKIHPDQMTDDE